MSKLSEIIQSDNWRIRRRVLFVALIWLGANVQFLLVRGIDSALNQQAILAMIAALVSLIVAYVFGAVWDDNNKRITLGEREGSDVPRIAPEPIQDASGESCVCSQAK